jgi:ketosteroid isomerase-like protein
MSHANVELVRQHFEAANRGDFAHVMSSYAPDVELVVDPPVILAGTYSGRDEVGRFFGDWFRTFGGRVHFDLRGLRDAGDAVVVAAHATARGGLSGAEVTTDYFYVYRLRDRKIVHVQFYETLPKALEAAGLSE